MFVLDFIIPQLVGKDINELWDVNDPMGILAALLRVEWFYYSYIIKKIVDRTRSGNFVHFASVKPQN